MPPPARHHHPRHRVRQGPKGLRFRFRVVVDTKQGQGSDGLLWIVEQIPGYVRSEDMSATLTGAG